MLALHILDAAEGVGHSVTHVTFDDEPSTFESVLGSTNEQAEIPLSVVLLLENECSLKCGDADTLTDTAERALARVLFIVQRLLGASSATSHRRPWRLWIIDSRKMLRVCGETIQPGVRLNLWEMIRASKGPSVEKRFAPNVARLWRNRNEIIKRTNHICQPAPRLRGQLVCDCSTLEGD